MTGLMGWPSGSLAQAQTGAVLARGESRTAPWASRVAEEAEASWPEYGSGGESWGEVLGNERAEEGARLRWIDGLRLWWWLIGESGGGCGIGPVKKTREVGGAVDARI